MKRHWGVIGAPSSAGAHTPGLEKGPAALRDAGLVRALRRGGHDVDDHGDVGWFRWRPDPEHPHGENASAVASVAGQTAAAVAKVAGAGQTPFVIGGDCSITVGVVAGLATLGAPPALLYMDGGPDLYTPATRPNGNLDAMGVAHLLAIPGHLPELAGVGPTVPLLSPDLVVSYGHTLPTDDVEYRLLEQLGIGQVRAGEVHADPVAAAGRALALIESAAPAFLLHFDVDVLLFRDAPIADVPDSGDAPGGLTLAEMATSLATFVASPGLAGVVLTEVNPDHAPDRAVLEDFVARLAGAVAAAPTSDR